MNPRIGFMQGRLSPKVNGKIQAFPWEHWEAEFHLAKELNFILMEWTLDHERLLENPLLTSVGQKRIGDLKKETEIDIHSVTGDCFMQAPFYKVAGKARRDLMEELYRVTDACAAMGIGTIVFPLVDHGRPQTPEQWDVLREGLHEILPRLKAGSVRVAFETDLAPTENTKFISEMNRTGPFWINYDIGNSAALGFDAAEEIIQFGKWIVNVHIKDRMLHGTTVPLGKGNADFNKVFKNLKAISYSGSMILQTARSETDDHATPLCHYRDYSLEKWRES